MYSLQLVSKHLYKVNARSATTDIDKFNIRWSFFRSSSKNNTFSKWFVLKKILILNLRTNTCLIYCFNDVSYSRPIETKSMLGLFPRRQKIS